MVAPITEEAKAAMLANLDLEGKPLLPRSTLLF